MLAHILVLLGEHIIDLLHGRDLLLLCLVCEGVAAEGATGLPKAVEVLLDPLDVLQPELSLDNLHVPDGVDVALDAERARGLVRPRARDVLDRVPAAAEEDERQVGLAEILHAVRVALHGEVEAAELVAREGVGAALEDDGGGPVPVEDVLDDLEEGLGMSALGCDDACDVRVRKRP